MCLTRTLPHITPTFPQSQGPQGRVPHCVNHPVSPEWRSDSVWQFLPLWYCTSPQKASLRSVAVKASFLIKQVLPKHITQFVLVAVGYTTNDVVYRWNSKRDVAIAEDMKLSQFDLIETPTANNTDVLQSGRIGVALCAICKYCCCL